MTGSSLAPRGMALVRTYAWLVVAITLLTAGVAAAVALQRPLTYTAISRVAVEIAPTQFAPIQPEMGSEREVASSGEVAALAARELNLPADDALEGLSASVITDTKVLSLEYSSPSREEALRGCTAFTTAYVEYRNSSQQSWVAKVITQPSLADPPAGRLQLVLAIALLLGLAVGLAAAFAWDRMSGRLRSASELEATGIPVLDFVLPAGNQATTSRGSADSDAFNHLAVHLTTLTGGRRDGVGILVTSPRADDVAMEISRETANAVANLGRNVVLVDANLRAPGLTAELGVPVAPGFVELLDGSCTLDQGIHPTDHHDVGLVPSGATGPPSTFDVESLQVALGRLASQAIFVLDGPALLEDPAAALLVDHVDVVLLVADLGTSTRDDIARAASMARSGAGRTAIWLPHKGGRTLNRRRQAMGSHDSVQPQLDDVGPGPTALR